MGVLKLPISARFLIHDGIHRRAAIESPYVSIPNSATRLYRLSSTSIPALQIRADLLGPETPRIPILSLAGDPLR